MWTNSSCWTHTHTHTHVLAPTSSPSHFNKEPHYMEKRRTPTSWAAGSIPHALTYLIRFYFQATLTVLFLACDDVAAFGRPGVRLESAELGHTCVISDPSCWNLRNVLTSSVYNPCDKRCLLRCARLRSCGSWLALPCGWDCTLIHPAELQSKVFSAGLHTGWAVSGL